MFSRVHRRCERWRSARSTLGGQAEPAREPLPHPPRQARCWRNAFFRNAILKRKVLNRPDMEAFFVGLHASSSSAGRAIRWINQVEKLGIAAHLGYCPDARVNTQPVAHVPRQNSTALQTPIALPHTTGKSQTRVHAKSRDFPRLYGTPNRFVLAPVTLEAQGRALTSACAHHR